jgi:hypothetical protein
MLGTTGEGYKPRHGSRMHYLSAMILEYKAFVWHFIEISLKLSQYYSSYAWISWHVCVLCTSTTNAQGANKHERVIAGLSQDSGSIPGQAAWS